MERERELQRINGERECMFGCEIKIKRTRYGGNQGRMREVWI